MTSPLILVPQTFACRQRVSTPKEFLGQPFYFDDTLCHIYKLSVVDHFNMQVLGILSERDVIHHLSERKKLDGMVAQDIMTAEVITVDQQVTSSELMHLMTENRIRHVPITKDNKLVGIVSIGDVVKRMLEKYERETKLIKQFINS